jgi:hypothetical protein
LVFYRKSRKGRRKGGKGGVVNATTFSFNPNLRELCADIVFFMVKTNLTALDWFFTTKAAKGGSKDAKEA